MLQQHLKIKTSPKTHVAIMRKSWGLTEKIFSGQKKIESRWYEHKIDPWDNIAEEDTIYFKNSGEPVSLKATVLEVIQISDLNPQKVKEILNKYAEEDGIEPSKFDDYYEHFKDKKYCILIFLKDVEKIEPFLINKKGFGAMSAWLTLDNIDKIKLPLKSKIKQKKLI